MTTEFPDLGVGVGLRTAHYSRFQKSIPSSISWVEVISEGYMNWKGEPLEDLCPVLLKIRQSIPVCLHGVSLSVGSTDPLNSKYLTALKDLIHQVEPAWISDHLCWTGVDGENLHDLMPIPYTEEALDWVVSRISKAQDKLKQRILIENVSHYFQYTCSQMPEWEFLSEVSRRADCGILLDINNIYVNSVNQNFDPKRYLSEIPWNRVGQIHVAGHTDLGTHLIDTHDTPVCSAVWDLLRYVTDRFGKISTMIERDGNIPEWGEMEVELQQIHRIREEENETTSSIAKAI